MVIGSTIGPYCVVGKLGEGGMGEVYRARDTALGREVALKILPDAFAHDAERLARFQREAHVLASLNHPNIAHIHGFEEQRALVMELVEGPTLAEVIAGSRLPPSPKASAGQATAQGSGPDHLAQSTGPGLALEDALAVARQIAEALEAAHEQGIIHRDLKPANVKVRDDGTVKVLDFGLAKALDPAQDSGLKVHGDNTHSPTITSPALTARGMFLGTAAYMAPEQARGKSVDRRADIWAFGCVLFEMLTGTRAFEGEEVSDTLAAVLRGDPDWTKLPVDVPPTLLVFLKRCLNKDPRQRVRDIGDMRLALAGSFDVPAVVGTDHVSARTGWHWWAMGAACVLLAGAAVGVAIWNVQSRPGNGPLPVVRFEVEVGSEYAVPATVATPLAVTPDGQRIVFSASQSSATFSGRLFSRSIDQLATLRIPGYDLPTGSVFVSPDGQWIGFFSRTQAEVSMKKIPITGGTAITLAQGFYSFNGASWGPRGTIAFSVDTGQGGLRLVPEGGGTVQTVPSTDQGTYLHPHFLRDGEWLLCGRSRAGLSTIVAVNTRTGEQKEIIQGGAPRYLESGHLVFGRDNAVWAARFDPATLEVQGDAVRVLEDAAAQRLSVSNTGTLVYLPRGETVGSTPVWVDRSGAATQLTIGPGDYWMPQLSPDGRRLAVGIGPDIWVIDLERGGRTRVTFGQTARLFPFTWTHDGREILFASPASNQISRVPADGSGKPSVLLEGKFPQWPTDSSPDGRVLAYYANSPQSQRDLWTVPLAAGATPSLFHGGAFQERSPKFSPDGRWIAYVSNESGRDEVYVRPYPGPGGQIAISTTGGIQPVWSATTRELLFRSGQSLMAVTFDSGATFSAGVPRNLFDTEDFVADMGPSAAPSYDAHPDGKRFLMLAAVPVAARARVVLNWDQELKRLLPAE